ncbi:hypothetical protein PMAYCL1PPCAC_22930, partial [Pristionchus mayeri]
ILHGHMLVLHFHTDGLPAGYCRIGIGFRRSEKPGDGIHRVSFLLRLLRRPAVFLLFHVLLGTRRVHQGSRKRQEGIRTEEKQMKMLP